MNALATLAPTEELDDERSAAVGRMDDDLRAVVAAARVPSPDVRETLAELRLRCIALYRTALIEAAGMPEDRRWSELAHAVAAFVRAASNLAWRDPKVQAAEQRLHAFAFD